MLKKGQRVLVWSLQSFSDGGFLKAEPAFVRQTSLGSSVLVSVIRNFKGKYKVDESYEVYIQQVTKVPKKKWPAKKKLKKFRREILNNINIT